MNGRISFKTKPNSKSLVWNSWQWWRLGCLAILTVLFCAPVFVTTSPLPPRITIIVDRTASMTRNDVTLKEVNHILESVTAAVKKLSPPLPLSYAPKNSPPYDVRTVFLETSSAVGDVLLREVSDITRDTAAVLLLTDGVITTGVSLSIAAAVAKRNHLPVSVIACGTENPSFDVQIQSRHQLLHTFHGGTVPVEAVVIGENVPQTVSHVIVTLKNIATDELLESWKIPVFSEKVSDSVSESVSTYDFNRVSEMIRTKVVSADKGVSHYRLSVSAVSPSVVPSSTVSPQLEWCLENNHDDFSVVTHDHPLRVLQLEDLPRMEFRYLYDFLSREPGIELTTLLADADSQWMEETSGMVSPEKLEKWVQHNPHKLAEMFDVVICGHISPSQLGPLVVDSLHVFAKTEQKLFIFLLNDTFHPQYTAIPSWQNLLPFGNVTDVTVSGTSPVQWRRGLFPFVDEVFPVFPVCVNHIVSPVLLQGDTSILATVNGFPLVCLKPSGAGHILCIGTDETWRWQDGDFHRRFWTEILRLFFVPADGISDSAMSDKENPALTLGANTVGVSSEFRVWTPQTQALVELTAATDGQFITAKEFFKSTENVGSTEFIGKVTSQTEGGTRPVIVTTYPIGSRLFWTLLLVGLVAWRWLRDSSS